MKKILAPMLATALIFAGTASFAEEGPKPDGKGPPHGRFKEADGNSDGFLTKSEMQEQQKKRLDEMFSKTDANKDGKLSPEEMKAGREEMRKRWKERKEDRAEDRAERKEDRADKKPGDKEDGGPDAPPAEDKPE